MPKGLYFRIYLISFFLNLIIFIIQIVFSYEFFKLPFGSIEQQFKQGLLYFAFLHLPNILANLIRKLFLSSLLFFLTSNILIVNFLCFFWKGGKIYRYHMLAHDTLSICVRTVAF